MHLYACLALQPIPGLSAVIDGTCLSSNGWGGFVFAIWNWKTLSSSGSGSGLTARVVLPAGFAGGGNGNAGDAGVDSDMDADGDADADADEGSDTLADLDFLVNFPDETEVRGLSLSLSLFSFTAFLGLGLRGKGRFVFFSRVCSLCLDALCCAGVLRCVELDLRRVLGLCPCRFSTCSPERRRHWFISDSATLERCTARHGTGTSHADAQTHRHTAIAAREDPSLHSLATPSKLSVSGDMTQVFTYPVLVWNSVGTRTLALSAQDPGQHPSCPFCGPLEEALSEAKPPQSSGPSDVSSVDPFGRIGSVR